MARNRKRRSGYRSFARSNYGREAAQKHIADAHRLSERLGGMDQEVKDYFFSLSRDQLAQVFKSYGDKYGEQKRSYAVATFTKWRDGTVYMSGLVAERLFDFLPPIMPIHLKLRIVEGLFENSGLAKSDYVLAPQNTHPSKIISFVGTHFFKDIEAQQIANELKSQFNWLAGEDAMVAEQILQHSLKLTVEAKKEATAAIMQQMDRDRAANNDVIREVVSTIRVRKHEVHIKRTEVVEEIVSVGKSSFDRGGRKPENSSGSDFAWLIWLAVIGVFWFLMTR